MAQASATVGIDLGTSNCCVGYLRPNGQVEIIDNEFGDRTTPSYVAFTVQKEIIGKIAKKAVFRNPENVVYDTKRLIGRKFSDEYLQQNLKLWPFQVVCNTEDDTPLIRIRQCNRTYSYKPHEISAKLLKYMKEMAEKRLGQKVESAVITVPAHFNYHQRTATKEAGQLAGLNVLKIINEPTAAALAYIHTREITDCENLVVVDIGGGTLDVSVITVRGKSVTVKATSGNTLLGGRDFDNNLTEFIVNKIKQHLNIDVRDKKTTMQRIKARSEKLKMMLSCQHNTIFDIVSMDGNDINIEISRTDFEAINKQLFDSSITTVENCLKHGSIEKRDISKILLIGGSSRIPKLQSLLKNLFSGNVELMVAVNPDEAVAYGAAIQASIYSRCSKTEAIELKDVTPLSLGVETYFGEMTVIIPRNTEIPVTRTTRLSTVINNQESVRFPIYEGERGVTKHNTSIGSCSVKIPPKPVGFPMEFLLRINESGILEVEVKLDAGNYSQLTIKYAKPSEHKINEILQDAIEHKTLDNRTTCAITKMINLSKYCERIKAICMYKAKHVSENDGNSMRSIAKDISTWVENNPIGNGTTSETDAIFQKEQEIEAICEPILKKYCFNIKNMSHSDFYNFVNET